MTVAASNPNKIYAPETCQCVERADCIDSRVSDYGGLEYRRRRYRCPACEHRWSSVEIVVSDGDHKGNGVAREALAQKFARRILTERLSDMRQARQALDVTIRALEGEKT